MSFFLNSGSVFWTCSYTGATSTLNELTLFVCNQTALGGTNNVNLTSTMYSYMLGRAGRYFFVRLAYPNSNDPLETLSGWTSLGTYEIVCQNNLYSRVLRLQPYLQTEGGLKMGASQQCFRLDGTAVSPNDMPSAQCRFIVFTRVITVGGVSTTEYALRSRNPDLVTAGTTFVTAATVSDADAGFVCTATVNPPDASTSFGVVGYAASVTEKAGDGPVLPSVTGGTRYGYYISALSFQDTPEFGDDFGWRQIKWTGSGITLEATFDADDVKTWTFEKVKSKVNSTPDSIYSYKIRSLGSTTNPSGYLTFTAGGITSDEFELLPQPSNFGAFCIRSVGHNGILKYFLVAASLGVSFTASTGIPTSTNAAWQLRPASTLPPPSAETSTLSTSRSKL